MTKRPVAVTIIGWLFIAAGVVSLSYHLLPGHTGRAGEQGSVWKEAVLVCLIRFLALLGGWFTLRGHNWARWLLVAWMVGHFILSFFHSPKEVIVHGLMFGVILFFLFRPSASAFFRSAARGLNNGT